MEDAVMLGLVGLDDHLSGPLSSFPAPSRGLCKQLEGTFSRPVIVHRQGHIRSHDSHQRHIGKIMSLDYHLGSHQDIRFSRGKCG